MHKIAIISSSVRIDRLSHRVALFFQSFITENAIGTVELLDLKQYNFPIFEERLSALKNPAPEVLDFAAKVIGSDGIIIVTPEYNGGYPASLKNAIDLLYLEWKRKPVALATVSNGPFAGAQVNTALAFTLWKIGALLVPATYQVPKVQDAYDEAGNPADKAMASKLAKSYFNELSWCMEATKTMKVT